MLNTHYIQNTILIYLLQGSFYPIIFLIFFNIYLKLYNHTTRRKPYLPLNPKAKKREKLRKVEKEVQKRHTRLILIFLL